MDAAAPPSARPRPDRNAAGGLPARGARLTPYRFPAWQADLVASGADDPARLASERQDGRRANGRNGREATVGRTAVNGRTGGVPTRRRKPGLRPERALIKAPAEHRVGRTAIIRSRHPGGPGCANSGRPQTTWRAGQITNADNSAMREIEFSELCRALSPRQTGEPGHGQHDRPDASPLDGCQRLAEKNHGEADLRRQEWR